CDGSARVFLLQEAVRRLRPQSAVRSQSAVASFARIRRQRNQPDDVALQTSPAPSTSPNPLVSWFGTKRSWVRIPPPRLVSSQVKAPTGPSRSGALFVTGAGRLPALHRQVHADHSDAVRGR